ncbi:phosphodiester glycosidase family protein [Flavobacterium sp. NRK F10]|uniref:phosphodiester glycosidase family protein n=1 Tax=Flavobacterium sp. NRK F10 TaxID=2954931 RepID=UPI002090601E|nr:phosphodiester glycosidase family protein [Flavobacterium sp. NRK F10]MCO6176399.1 phosphodiester glycosidase family protein [Flavobacterium sp. NRK F10]
MSFFLLFTTVLVAYKANQDTFENRILAYKVDPKIQNLQFYWKNDEGTILKNIKNLKDYIESKNQTLIFAMNGGMYNKDFSPQGLFIQEKKMLSSLDTANGKGNFYLKPNGIFYVTTNNTPFVCKTNDFKDNGNIKYATQSGPMLLIDGKIHPAFRDGSKNLTIRNGVGILPDNKVVFAMSKKEINFYDFAKYFQSLGCKNALYLDGFVSRMYLPEEGWVQTDGNFGVMIGVTTKNK